MTSHAYQETIAPIDDGGHCNVATTADAACDQTLIHRIRAGDFDTRQQLVTSNLLHVLRSNKSYGRNGTRIFDLLKAGERGLSHALENFGEGSQEHFSAYAASCIRRHVEGTLNQPRPVPGIRPQST